MSVNQFQQVTEINAWRIHEELVKERVRKTMARQRTLDRDFREVQEFTEVTDYLRWGVGGRMVQCALAEASHVRFTRKEWL